MQTKAETFLTMLETSTTEADILQSLIAPGSMPLLSVNEILNLINKQCGNDAAKAFQALVLKQITVEELSEPITSSLKKFCANRTDIVSRSLTRQLEKL